MSDTSLKLSPEQMGDNAKTAARLMKSLSHEGRLMLLCHLGNGECSVSELEAQLGFRQAAVSQMLARLREDALVSSRREGKTVLYRLADGKAGKVIELLYELYCADKDEK